MSIHTSILNCFPCNFAGTICRYYGNIPVNLAKFDQVLQKLLMRLVWNLIEYFFKFIHFDVNSDGNSQPFSMWFCRHHLQVLRQHPCKFGEVWISTSKVINEISVKFDWVFLKFIHFDVNFDVNSQPFSM